MKIILLHGDHESKIAERLTKFIDVARVRKWKIERLGGSDSSNIRESVANTSLFDENKFYILENPRKLKKSDAIWLKKNHKRNNSTLVIVNHGQLVKTAISALPTPEKEEVFELPKKIWNFLDSMYPGNAWVALRLLHEATQKEAIELVYALLARHLRDLYIVKINADGLKIPPWRGKKLSLQAQKYSKSQLKGLIRALANADYEAKTGGADLGSALDLMVATRLE